MHAAVNRLGIQPGLGRDHFKLVAYGGFGDGHNSYAQGMAWFDGKLYVSTIRGAFALMRRRQSASLGLDVWPVEVPADPYDVDLCAEIWAYDPRIDLWERAYKAPLITASDGSTIPRDFAYRSMVVHQEPGEAKPALYVCTWSPAKGPGPIVLRSADGRHFEPTCEPGLVGLPVTTIRTMVSFKGRLYTTPAGSRGGNTNISGHVVIYESRDPAAGQWEPVCDFGFGDLSNKSVHEMCAWGDYLYAGTLNLEGFQLWRSRCEGEPPYEWELVLQKGAWRGPLNQGVLSMAPFKDALYIGTGIQGGGIDKQNKVGPAPAEVLRVREDKSWDLLVGDPRDTPDGRKEPLSGRLAGFDNFFNGYIWRMCVHDGWLYTGTFEWSAWLGFVKHSRWPGAFSNVLAYVTPKMMFENHSGFDMYRTNDGENWVPVTVNGMGNPYNMGLRTFQSTPYGLFFGTANPWGPKVMPLDGDDYVFNPRGGCEVFLGRWPTSR
ncbi:hypothetical protein [Ideonella sp. BN130291]|uniref:hypothetical protein n=1 Tax=Ideonella sp. BN130291 TaxID=3112940 RepID=UPI002E26781B|nr:hypothetical protein [Ideonella sp. BN130291]